MSHAPFAIGIDKVVDLLGLQRNPRNVAGATSYNVKCPFCDDPKYHMNINTVKNVYFCPRCMDPASSNSGALDLYGRVRLGTPHVKGRNGKELFGLLRADLGGDIVFRNDTPRTHGFAWDTPPAPNRNLDRAYRALLTLPYLELSKNHRTALESRGLSEEDIDSEMFATIREPQWIISHCCAAEDMYQWYIDNNIEDLRKNAAPLRAMTEDDVVAGLLIARDLVGMGVGLTQVPGFFKLAGRWCFRTVSGMLIPTVALDGCIVGLQVRMDTPTEHGLRYMTVSSKGLNGGVTTKIGRVHVSASGEISQGTEVLLTEGPLKATVIRHLLMKRGFTDFAVIGIQGVNNTRELPGLLSELKGRGVKRIYLALDMDKCCNLNVAKAGVSIRKIITQQGLSPVTVCWDSEYACKKYNELALLCVNNGLEVPEHDDIYTSLCLMARLLSAKDIQHSVKVVNGRTLKDYWRSETKGLDDYLKFIATEGAE